MATEDHLGSQFGYVGRHRGDYTGKHRSGKQSWFAPAGNRSMTYSPGRHQAPEPSAEPAAPKATAASSDSNARRRAGRAARKAQQSGGSALPRGITGKARRAASALKGQSAA